MSRASEYVPSGMEKGTPAWDIGILLTRHQTVEPSCAKVLTLRRNVGQLGHARLAEARKVVCTCGAGDSTAENTS